MLATDMEDFDNSVKRKVAEIKQKESDEIEAMRKEFLKLGKTGKKKLKDTNKAVVDSYWRNHKAGDHNQKDWDKYKKAVNILTAIGVNYN